MMMRITCSNDTAPTYTRRASCRKEIRSVITVAELTWRWQCRIVKTQAHGNSRSSPFVSAYPGRATGIAGG